MSETESVLKQHTEQLYRLEKNDREQDDRIAMVERESISQGEDIREIKDNTTWIRRAIAGGQISLAVVVIGGLLIYLITGG